MNKLSQNFIGCCCLVFTACTSVPDKPIYKDPNRSIDERVEDLLSRMTLEEKVLQLSQYVVGINDNVNNIGEVNTGLPYDVGSYIYFNQGVELRNSLQKNAVDSTRLGIPVLFGFDVIHGFRTIYPIPLAQGCSWNLDLVEELSAIAASEARRSGIDWTFSPMIDVARDGRWGRISEGYGEDPYYTGVMGAAAVRGYQGESLNDPDRVAACLKHYVGYGRSEGGRDYTATDISRQSLWETYLPPYKTCVEAGARTVMSAFNDISGVPATANSYLLTDILKNKWNFDGFVVSDWNAVEQLISQGAAVDKKEAALISINAGLDMDMKDDCFRKYMGQLVEEGKVNEDIIDEAVRRVLRVKFELGLFEHPYAEHIPESERFLKDTYIAKAAQMAQESMVLLKNENKILPLSKGKTYAVIGPIAKDQSNILGAWKCHGNYKDVETLFEGLTKVEGNVAHFIYAEGCGFDDEDTSKFPQAIAAACKADVVILCLGEKATWSGENATRSTLRLPAIQEKLAAELKKVGKPIVMVLSSGRPLELISLQDKADAILEIWQPGIAGGTPMAELLFGDANPSGKLCVTFPLTTGQIPIYYNERQSSRPNMGHYQDIPSKPMYEFGYGLSYTTFTYADLKLSSNSIKKNDKLTVSVDVTNLGEMDGMEIVHWFIRDPFSTITRPIKELKYFEKKMIRKGETITYIFEVIPERDLSYVDPDGNSILESGEYYIIVKDQTAKFIVQ